MHRKRECIRLRQVARAASALLPATSWRSRHCDAGRSLAVTFADQPSLALRAGSLAQTALGRTSVWRCSSALAPIVELRENETGTAVLMFAYSFLAMTAYNIVKPITRSQFISSLGADNLPTSCSSPVFIVGFIMQGYSRLGGLLPGEWVRAGDAGRRWSRCSWAFWFAFRLGLDVGGRRLLPVRPDLRHPAHQPVLDAGQQHLRPAPGEAAVRVHRRRRQPRGRRRRRHHLACSPRRSATPTCCW